VLFTNKYVRYGSSPRGAQAIILVAKVRAVLSNRFNVSFDDIRRSAVPCLRHRLIMNFEGEAEGIRPEKLIQEVIEGVPQDAGKT
jgi:MoxR-like ATPase